MAFTEFFRRAFGAFYRPEFYIMQGSKTVDPTDISYATGVWAVVDRDGNAAVAKAVRVKAGSAGGDLVVHLVENPAGEYETYDLEAGDDEGFVFDQIIESGTTITLTDLKIYI